jgi:hypothetical protein
MRIKQLIPSMVAIAFVCAGAYFLWKVLAFFVEKMTQINPAISAAIIGAMATVVAGIIAVVITQRQTKLRDIAEAHRATKVEIYKEYLETITRLLQSSNEKLKAEPIHEHELIRYFFKFKTQIILWGGPTVIKAEYEFEKVSRQGGNLFKAVDNLYRAIREDIGLSNKGLPSLQLVKMYLANPDEIDQKTSNSSAQPIAGKSGSG